MTKNLKLNRLLLTTILIIFSGFHLIAQTNDGSRYAANSVLSQGDWYKIKVDDNGVYKLTYEDLKKIGLKDPKNVKIYGYGGWILDENFRQPYVDDLPPVSIWMSKEPSSFGSGDYILFYARGSIKWSYSTKDEEFTHTQNPYSSESYYFITENSEPANIMVSENHDIAENAVELTTFDDYLLHEKDLVNIIQSGREFYGESFKSTTSQTFNFNLPGVTSEEAKIRYDFIARASGAKSYLDVYINNSATPDKTNSFSSQSNSYIQAESAKDFISKTNLSENLAVKMTYRQASGSDQNIHLNYIRVNFNRQLKAYNGVTLFRSKQFQPEVKYKISNANEQMLVFNVTDNYDSKQVRTTLSGGVMTFGASNSSIKEYALVDPSKTIPTPSLVGKVANQDLHASEAPEMIIIVQPLLQKKAEELAALHEENSGLRSLIVNPENVFNEFSCGKPDATAFRRFAKMFYDRAQSEDNKPKYFLLFGDGSYDNRFITNEWSSSESRGMLLTYQSSNSISEYESFVTDDYFGFLDDEEGSSLDSAKLDIGVGRLPVRDEAQATTVVKKIERYMKNEENGVQLNGIWQNTVTFVADDAVADNNATSSEMNHIQQTDEIAETLKSTYPSIIINKVYEDSYERTTTSTGAKSYPDAKKAMMDRINKGTLVLNYIGHGSTRDWSHEYILTYPEVEEMTNTKLPLWITATCDYSRFDGVSTSGGELALLNSRGGAIALFSTVRVVYISNNKKMNAALFKHLFEEENGEALRLGDIMKRAKCESNLYSDSNKLRFLLLGDPALKLNYPDNKHKIKVTEVNGASSEEDDIVIKALASNLIKGEIVDSDGNIVQDFTGTIDSFIFDNEQDMKTRGYKKDGETMDTSFPYKDFTNTIFAGKTEIKNGKFEIAFVTPKDILYTEGEGKMSFYAQNNEKTKEAQGYFNNYMVGGTDEDAKPETNAPDISALYLNDKSFKSGGKVNPTPMFYAEVSDDTGINLSSAIGHNISILIDNKTAYDLSSSFVNEDSSAKAGSIKYLIPELKEGKHTLQFKVWDVWNNSATQDIEFEVINNYRPNILNFTIAGNPAKDNVKFIFTSDVPGSNVKVKYMIYSLNGALQWIHEESGPADMMSYYTYNWDLTTNRGSRMKAGIYICKVFVSIDGVEESNKSEKLIILE